ncbi:MAG: hypothetical protein LBI28_13705 [Treponema sp.]|nr:hypothetical protein [Treponema sp.]
MNLIRLLKPGLFIYECIRIMVITTVILINGYDSALLIILILTAPGVLFPLMSLFIWLDTKRYSVYLPLFAVGKCIGILLLLGWLIASRKYTMIGSFFSIKIISEFLLLAGDLLALTSVALFIKFERQLEEPKTEQSEPAEKPEITEN